MGKDGITGFENLVEFRSGEVGKRADMEVDAFGQLGLRRRGQFNLITDDGVDIFADGMKRLIETFGREFLILSVHSLFEFSNLGRIGHDTIDEGIDLAEIGTVGILGFGSGSIVLSTNGIDVFLAVTDTMDLVIFFVQFSTSE